MIVLPANYSKAFVYRKYQEACSNSNTCVSTVGRSKFYDMCASVLPFISISTPSSDLCFTCQQLSLAVQKSFCVSEEEKLRRMEEYQEHLQRAQKERIYYNTQIAEATEKYEQRQQSGEKLLMCHYSFDFAQQVHFSFDCQQSGPEYFKTVKKCGVFGVCNDCTNVPVNYLINEEESPRKGADCVISLVHHYLENYSSGASSVLLQADNCVGQNKNNCTMQYLVWHSMTKRDLSVELSFMLTGHTSFL